MKKNYKTAMAKNEGERSYSDYRVIREYEDIQRKKRQRAEAAKNRSCSYCEEKGHNRTTCPTKKHFFSLHKRASRIAQNLYIDTVLSTGQFTGSLIEVVRNTPKDRSYRDNGTFVYYLNELPKVMPLLVNIVREGHDNWYIEGLCSTDQADNSMEFYKSEDYKKLLALSYLNTCGYKNVRLLGGNHHAHNIPYYDKTQQGLPQCHTETWKHYPSSGLAPKDIYTKLASYWSTLPLYRGYKRITGLETYKCPVPRFSDNSEWAKSFRSMINEDFKTKIAGRCKTTVQTVYAKEDSHRLGHQKMLEAYIEALSSEYEFKHF
tara:strand:+ start:1286 stop:2242 length:957 start_codon:yes stop_codon:yes gene_type:complete